MKSEILKKLNAYLFRELDPAFARRARILVKELALTGNEHVLEVGCGRGYYEGLLSYLYPSLTITAIDLSEEYLARARKKVESKKVTFVKADALKLPWKADSFDRVFATEVLEHLPDDVMGLKEMYRVLKPGGRVVVTVPNKNYPALWDPLNKMLESVFHTHVPKHIWWLAGIWADHVRLFTPVELETKAQKAGFTLDKMFLSTHASIVFEHFLLYGIGKNIVERGFLPGFYRFQPEATPSLALKIIRSFLYFQDHKNKDTEEKYVSTVNIIASLNKK